MIREIIKPQQEEYTIHIPKEYLNHKVEILILPFDDTTKEILDPTHSDTISTLQEHSMAKTWENSEDEAWDGL
ncbi:MAG: hypothetical protein U9R50_05425 [Campylobacterota bacterium]|nr:hypothetical protein [Campylobacterota bacterium]